MLFRACHYPGARGVGDPPDGCAEPAIVLDELDMALEPRPAVEVIAAGNHQLGRAEPERGDRLGIAEALWPGCATDQDSARQEAGAWARQLLSRACGPLRQAERSSTAGSSLKAQTGSALSADRRLSASHVYPNPRSSGPDQLPGMRTVRTPGATGAFHADSTSASGTSRTSTLIVPASISSMSDGSSARYPPGDMAPCPLP